jgi:hypothetical protein
LVLDYLLSCIDLREVYKPYVSDVNFVANLCYTIVKLKRQKGKKEKKKERKIWELK